MLGSDEFTRPLGLDRKPSRWAGLADAIPFGRIAVGGCGLVLAALMVAPFVLDGRNGGEPSAVAPIETVRPEPASSPLARPAESPPQRETSTAEELEKDSGVSVMRGGGAGAPGSVVIRVPDPPSALRLAAAPDPRLIEAGRHGPLPRIAADGATPALVYARPAMAKGRPRIAIVVGGMGLNAAGTTSALARLPDAVTLAFAPYARDLERQIGQARTDGHEVLLQVPMEPFDYPLSDPGPHTLIAGARPAETLDRLHWLMSRASGYVGLVNFMGAKFTADEAAMLPLLRELGQRGLIFLDDGASARSVLPALANSAQGQALKADLVVDATETADAIDKALARLEVQAREKGRAVGTASALPVSIERIARWAQGLDARGFDLTPVSAIAASGKAR